jgi:hypothetical protein
MTGCTGRAVVTAALLAGGLALGMPARAAIAANVTPVDNPTANPTTLRAAVELAGQHFGFTVVGANRIGTDTPEWPAENLPAEGVIDTLLKDYSYIVLLQPESAPGARREPKTLVIVGLNHPPTDAPAAAPTPAAARTPTALAAAQPVTAVLPAASAATSHTPSWAPPPSTVVRTLTKLAETNGNGASDADQQQGTQPTEQVSNPADNAAAMAALTRSAQSGLGALVTGLRQACPNPKAC